MKLAGAKPSTKHIEITIKLVIYKIVINTDKEYAYRHVVKHYYIQYIPIPLITQKYIRMLTYKAEKSHSYKTFVWTDIRYNKVRLQEKKSIFLQVFGR